MTPDWPINSYLYVTPLGYDISKPFSISFQFNLFPYEVHHFSGTKICFLKVLVNNRFLVLFVFVFSLHNYLPTRVFFCIFGYNNQAEENTVLQMVDFVSSNSNHSVLKFALLFQQLHIQLNRLDTELWIQRFSNWLQAQHCM